MWPIEEFILLQANIVYWYSKDKRRIEVKAQGGGQKCVLLNRDVAAVCLLCRAGSKDGGCVVYKQEW